jgi:hypothetical protein
MSDEKLLNWLNEEMIDAEKMIEKTDKEDDFWFGYLFALQCMKEKILGCEDRA